MSFLKQDSSQAGGEFTVLPEGDYEVFLTGAELKDSASSEYQYFNCVYVIRDDVEQEGKGRKIWDIYSLSPKAAFKFHALNKAIGVEDGFEFESAEDWYQFVLGKSFIATLGTRIYTNNSGEKVEQNTVKAVKPSQVGGEYVPEEEGNKDPFKSNGSVTINDDDLPF